MLYAYVEHTNEVNAWGKEKVSKHIAVGSIKRLPVFIKELSGKR